MKSVYLIAALCVLHSHQHVVSSTVDDESKNATQLHCAEESPRSQIVTATTAATATASSLVCSSQTNWNDAPSNKPPHHKDDTDVSLTCSREEEEAEQQEEEPDIQVSSSSSPFSCDLYLAPSTIEGAGLGIFVGSVKEPGDVVAVGDVAIPIVDVDFHHMRREYFSTLADYQWMGARLGMGSESDDEDGVGAFIPGIDAAVNCKFGLLNAFSSIKPQFESDAIGLHRSRNPGAGANTLYSKATTEAMEYIPAGGEVFKDYGRGWFIDRQTILGKLPFDEDYERAEQIARQWYQLNISSNDIKDDLWERFITTNMLWPNRLTRALSMNADDARLTATKGIRALLQLDATRSIQFLEQHGRCMSVIQAGPSTIPGAGRGAFVQRAFQKGEVITGSPLLHVYASFFHMYEPSWNEETQEWQVTNRRKSNRIGEQLLLNYCFGHADSKLLLCPYAAGVNLINHNQSMANVRVQWAPHGQLSHNNTWLEWDTKELEFLRSVGLAFDYVATRDIVEGEELFLDYGDAWEEAWLDHAAAWEPSQDDSDYAPASEWNEYDESVVLKTVSEQDQEGLAFPDNLQLRCHLALEEYDWYEEYEGRALEGTLWNDDEYGWPCRIVERYWDDVLQQHLYDLELDILDPSSWKFVETTFHEGVPRGAMKFVDRPYSTDIHMDNAFRQALHVPDDIFPDTWRSVA